MSEGRRGKCLDVYSLVKAAKYLGCTPWELAEQPSYWRNVARDLENTDIKVKNETARRAEIGASSHT